MLFENEKSKKKNELDHEKKKLWLKIGMKYEFNHMTLIFFFLSEKPSGEKEENLSRVPHTQSDRV